MNIVDNRLTTESTEFRVISPVTNVAANWRISHESLVCLYCNRTALRFNLFTLGTLFGIFLTCP